MSASETFTTKLKQAHVAIDHAITYLNEAQFHSKEALPEPKHRRLLRNTITNLRRRRRIILTLIDTTTNAPLRNPTLPGFPTSPRHTNIVAGKWQSPDKCPPSRSE